jgi:hypothetical protein
MVRQLTLARRQAVGEGDVVEQQEEPLDAESDEHLQLVDEYLPVGGGPVVDVEAGRDREAELHARFGSAGREFGELLALGVVVGKPPVAPMLRLVLRGIDVCVHLVVAEKVEKFEPRVV